MTNFSSPFFWHLLSQLSLVVSDDDVACDDEAEINRILDEGFTSISNALSAYLTDQSDNNCENLRGAYSDWIDELERFQSCADAAGQGSEFRDAINESRTAINDLPCG